MYVPPLFKNNNIEETHDFIEKNSFGILVSQTNSKLWGTHIPLELDKNEDGKDVLLGHISKGNPQWENFADNTQVLAIFSGPHSYISSSWYDHENVPTWNYIAVHVYGTVKIIEGDKLLHSLKKLVDKYEQGSEKPISVEHMQEHFVRKSMNGIVGFEIEIEEIQSAYKLSQNRDSKNHQSITGALEKKGDALSIETAEEMKKHQRK